VKSKVLDKNNVLKKLAELEGFLSNLSGNSSDLMSAGSLLSEIRTEIAKA
jgi:predicted nucleotidyltransferase